MKDLVLIADDEYIHRRTLGDILQRVGCCVMTAENGASAIQLVRTIRPRLILMDIQMPVLDGLSAVKILKASRDTKSITAIAVTALTMPGDRERILKAGFDGYLPKPVNITELCSTVQRFLSVEPAQTEVIGHWPLVIG